MAAPWTKLTAFQHTPKLSNPCGEFILLIEPCIRQAAVHSVSGGASFLPFVFMTSTVTGVGRTSAMVDFLASFFAFFLGSLHLISLFPTAPPLKSNSVPEASLAKGIALINP